MERLSGLVGRPSESHPLHNSGLLSLDPVQDKTPLYSQLLQAYKWSNKVNMLTLYSQLLQAYKWSNKLLQAYKWSNKLLQAYKWSNKQSLKRSANQMGASAKRRPKVQPSTLVLPPQYVDDVISRIGRMFPDLTIELFRPNGTSAVLLAIVVMRSLFIDRTVVRGFNENVYTEDGKTWLRSYINLSLSCLSLVSQTWLRSYINLSLSCLSLVSQTWLRSYIKLFQSPCQRCGRFLQDGLPPTWRDFRTLEAFHDTCRM
ncbi:Mediator of RNA polymerase II transcription subunit 27 [Dissostichus eleginoides]|uniref:Mediator of RNA polymerase II transcription subunit 27 n=1 Tax=Dissostichus eleginoides TaxID=100907 RepID=A0AAD9ESN1_DISEL|nr:Mediator of RNA polymerase II transcription subunit 27 [Dissostichus eleginoides]